MIELRIARALLCTAALGLTLAGATSNAADRPATLHVAAASSATDPALKEIANYKLTMDAVRKFAQASKTMKQYEKDHPELNQDDEEDDNDDDSASLDDMEAKIASIPEARKAIEGAGLSVREYVVITFAMLQSAISQYAIEQGADPAKIARDAGVHPANVTFYKEHKAEIEALTADMKEAETDE
jgi:hypothetical protein